VFAGESLRHSSQLGAI